MTRKKRTARAQPAKEGRSETKGKRPAPRARSQERGAGLSLARSGGPAVRLAGVQRQVTIGRAGDAYEKEAEQVAQRVAAGKEVPRVSLIGPGGLAASAASAARRQPAGEEEELETGGEGASEAIASRAIERRGAGRPLNPGVRSRLEPAFGADLSHVRVHDRPEDREAAAAINARAFTHGSDIWLGPGESDEDIQLMAHEMTHVFQQGAASRGAVQRAPAVVQRSEAGSREGSPTGVVHEGNIITFSAIEIPRFKVEAEHRARQWQGPLMRNRRFSPQTRGQTRQNLVWKEDVDKGKIITALEAKWSQAYGGEPPEGAYVFKAPSKTSKSNPRYFVGDLQAVAQELTIPTWDDRGEPHSYDVDHILELQLAYWPDNPRANEIENMELLDSGVNRSSGPTIRNRIDRKVSAFIQATDGQFGTAVSSIKQSYDLEFLQAQGASIGRQPGPHDYWTREQIEDGRHLSAVQPATLTEVGGNGTVSLYPSSKGGQPKQFSLPNLEGQKTQAEEGERDWLAPFVIKEKEFHINNDQPASPGGENASQRELFGTLWVNVPEGHQHWRTLNKDEPVKLWRLAPARFAGYVDEPSVLDLLGKLVNKHTSPIRVDDVDVLAEGGIYAAGAILPETPLFRELDLRFELSGDDLSVYKAFRPGELNVPAPFRVKDSSLTLTMSTERGLALDGQIDFAIDKVGEGYVRGAVSTAGGLALQGRFTFDTELFESAQIDLWYRDDAFGARGTMTIGPGKVRGIRSGRITVEYSNERLSAEGVVTPAIPGVEQGRMTASYSEEEGLVIGGGLTFSRDVPGIRSGSIDVTLRKGEDGWKVSAAGSARPDIPGIDATLSVSYEDGLFTIQGSAAYRRGMLRGNVELGVTNRQVDESGQPTGEPGERLRAFGGGSVTVRFAPWLEGTVGVRLLENGEIELVGRVGFPDSIELFEGLSYEKDILRPPPLDIPIVGVAAAGRRIGIFATIRGGLQARAGIGPGVLQDVSLGVTYNPDREDETHVTGSAKLHVPASAGLRLYVQGGIGAGIPLVSATAGLEVGGELGLEGALETRVNVDWTPARGLKFEAVGEVYVQPKFRFNIEAFVNVELDLLLRTITLYEQSWELAAVEFGANLRFGLKFPVRYEEGKPFDISLSDVEFTVPDVDVKELISDLVASIV